MSLLAPNGKPSNLTPEQWRLVRTPEFKAWFGNWEQLAMVKRYDSGIDDVSLASLSKDVSKVVDENGEPLVVYHGTQAKFQNFEVPSHFGKVRFSTDGGAEMAMGQKSAIYFTSNIDAAKTYASLNARRKTSIVKMAFLSIKNPYIIDAKNKSWSGRIADEYKLGLRNAEYDGIIVKKVIDSASSTEAHIADVYAVKNPNQIKLADGTNAALDGGNADRYDDGGVLKYEKAYKRGGGGYTTIVNGKLVTIEKQYSDNTWIAQSEDGNIDIERETLSQVKHMLEQINNPNTELSNGGSVLIAPNGKPSNLTPEQYKLVRTRDFKAWFGDWQNDPENASKVVDENGEPMVMWHYSKRLQYEAEKFYTFRVDRQLGSHFGTLKQAQNLKYIPAGESEVKTSNKELSDFRYYQVFLNIKKPIRLKDVGIFDANTLTDVIGREIKTYDWEYINNYGGKSKDSLLDRVKYIAKTNYGYDGVVYLNRYEADAESSFVLSISDSSDKVFKTKVPSAEDSWIAFYPNQIKLADGTNTSFDSNNPDIRFDDGGEAERSFITDAKKPNVYFVGDVETGLLTLSRDKFNPVIKDNKEYLRIDNVVVPKNLRNKGVATKLYEEALKKAKEEGYAGIVSDSKRIEDKTGAVGKIHEKFSTSAGKYKMNLGGKERKVTYIEPRLDKLIDILNVDNEPNILGGENFSKDFMADGGNKAVNKSGKPIKVYSGKRIGDKFGLGYGAEDIGEYFTDNPREANQYSIAQIGKKAFDEGRTSPATFPAYVKLKNPYIMDSVGYASIIHDTTQYNREQEIKEIKDKGHDGIIVTGVGEELDNYTGEESTWYIPFDNKNVISAITGKSEHFLKTQDFSAGGSAESIDNALKKMNLVLKKDHIGSVNYNEINIDKIDGQYKPDIITKAYKDLSKSIKKNGVRPLLIFKKTGAVLDGTHRLEILREMGVKNIPVIEFDGEAKDIYGKEDFLDQYDEMPLVRVGAESEKTKTEQKGEHVYHGTGKGQALGIQRDGFMRANRTGEQQPSISFTNDLDYAKYYAKYKGGSGGPVILRTKLDSSFKISDRISDNKGDEYITFDNIPASALELMIPDGSWMPLDKWDVVFNEPISALNDGGKINQSGQLNEASVEEQEKIGDIKGYAKLKDVESSGGYILTDETIIDDDYGTDDVRYQRTKAYKVSYRVAWMDNDTSRNPDERTFTSIDSAFNDAQMPGDWWNASVDHFKEIVPLYQVVWLDRDNDEYEQTDEVLNGDEFYDTKEGKVFLDGFGFSDMHGKVTVYSKDFGNREESSIELLYTTRSLLGADLEQDFLANGGERYRIEHHGGKTKYSSLWVVGKDDEVIHDIQLRIADHTYNPRNNDASALAGNFISVEIANVNPTKDRFNTAYSLQFDGEDTYEDVLDRVQERLREILSNISYPDEGISISDINDGGQLNEATDTPDEFHGNKGVGALIYCKTTGRFLLLKRGQDVSEPDTWGMVSGKVDDDDSHLEYALSREIEEELDVMLHDFTPTYIFRKGDFTFHNYISFVYEEFEPILNWENQDYLWVAVEDFPDNLHFGLRALMQNVDLHTVEYKQWTDEQKQDKHAD
jgi:predicted GNAT family acetyltransferase/8-oxo-dGTP pyrophosphatase MutT (NUDIX family)